MSEESEGAGGNPRSGRPKLVLIVEPNSAARIYAAQLTAALGFRVILAASTEDALSLIEKQPGRLDAVLANLSEAKAGRLAGEAAAFDPLLRIVRTAGDYSRQAIAKLLGPPRKKQ